MTIDPAPARPAPTAAPTGDGGVRMGDELHDEIVRQAQKMEAIGLFVAGVAHELNNPLAAIVGFSHLLRTDPDLPADLRHQADLLVLEANRTRVIVQNLLDFARQSPPERVETELRPLVDSVISLQSYLSRNSVAVEVDIPADLPRLSIDRSQIQQVLVNLTVNAAQAIAELGRPGRIRIEARPATSDAGRPTVRIAIADDGPGVAPSMRDRLFVPFVTSKKPGQGTGLGLSVSFGIIAGHGGTLHHEPNPGGGAIFMIELPLGRRHSEADVSEDRPAPASSPEAAVSRAEPPSSAAATHPAPTTLPVTAAESGSAAVNPGSNVRILVLDDEPSIREFLGRVLTRVGYEPVLATTGQAALEIVASDPPAAILCDHRMAGMSGTEFHDAVAAIDAELGRRFAFMSGDVLNPELRAFATERGVQLLPKPFDIAAVGSMVRRLLAPDA